MVFPWARDARPCTLPNFRLPAISVATANPLREVELGATGSAFAVASKNDVLFCNCIS